MVNRAWANVCMLSTMILLGGCSDDSLALDSLFDVSVSTTTADRMTEIQFTATANQSASDIVASEWLWDFGDGNASTASTTTHRYATLGEFQPTLKVTLESGSTKSISIPEITIENIPPTASGQAGQITANRIEEIQFFDSSTDADGSIASWHWDFGAGDPGTATAQTRNASYLFSELGSYEVSLTVTDNEGSTNTTSIGTITVENLAPTPLFDYYPTTPGAGEQVSFNDQSMDRDGTINAWNWDFGDGGRSTAQTPTHTYERPGTYTVSLTVRDNEGKGETMQNSIVVTGASVAVSDFEYTDQWCSDDMPFSFTLKNVGFVDADRIAIRVSGGYQDYSATVPSLGAGESGTISGTIKANDRCGSSDIYSITVTATPSNGSSVQRNWSVDL